MDFNSIFKEKLGKMLFLEVKEDGFRKLISIPEYVKFKNNELFIPVSSEHITQNANNEIALKNLPIYYFVEGMFYALGCDEHFKYNEDYEALLTYINDSENCVKSIISKRVNEGNLEDAYVLLKGLYKYSGEKDVYKNILLIGEAIWEKDAGFKDFLLRDIEEAEKEDLKIAEGYLYKSLVCREDGDYAKAKIAINEYKNNGGVETADIVALLEDIDNVTAYETAIEGINEDPEESIKKLLKLLGKFDKHPLIYYYLGVAYRKLENYDKAIYYLNESIAIESGILEVVVELGLNFACLGEYENALAYFKKAFEASRDVEICTNIITCYINLKDYEQAKLHLEIAKKLNPEDEIVQEIDRMVNSKL